MKQIVFISALLILLSACGSAPAATPTALPTEIPLPVVQVDTQHMITPNLAYEIPAGQGFALDASAYDFGIADGPSAVQVVMSGRAFQTAWLPGATRMPIFASALEPVTGTGRLGAFPSGLQLIVAIGSVSEKGQFEPAWVGVVNVQ